MAGRNVLEHSVSRVVKVGVRFKITNSGSSAVNNYPVPIMLDSNNWDWSYGLSEVIDENGNTLQHWVEFWDTNNKKACVWVKVSLRAGESITLTFKYGSSVNYGSRSGMFLLYFDDDIGSWSVRYEDSSWAGGVTKNYQSSPPNGMSAQAKNVTSPKLVGNYSFYEYIWTDGSYIRHWSIEVYKSGLSVSSSKIKVRFLMKYGYTTSSRYAYGIGIVLHYSDGNYELYYVKTGSWNGSEGRPPETSAQVGTAGEFGIYELTFSPNGRNFDFVLRVFHDSWDYTECAAWAYWDSITVRPYVDPEPTVECLGEVIRGVAWQYYSEFAVTEQSGTDLTDYAVMIKLDDTNWDWQMYLSDVRDQYNRQLAFWVEEWDSSSKSAIVWVKIPYLPANGSVKIRLIGDVALNRGNGEEVFEFFDDFDGASIDINKWNTYQRTDGSITVENSLLKLDNSLIISKSYQITDGIIETKVKIISKEGSMFARASGNTGDQFESSYGLHSGDFGVDNTWNLAITEDNVRKFTDTTRAILNEWLLLRFTLNGNFLKGERFKYVDMSSNGGPVEGTLTKYSSGYIGLRVDGVGNGDRVSYYDWIRVRKYVDNEPAVSYVRSVKRAMTDLDTSNVGVAVAKVVVTEQSGSDLTDYQVKITLDSSNWNWKYKLWRVVDENGNVCRHWIEEWNEDGKTATVWVKVSNIPANGTATIYLYGHEEWLVNGDPEEVFELFLNFNKLTMLSEGSDPSQDASGNGEILDDGRTFHTWGNSWKVFTGFGTFSVKGDGSQILELKIKANDVGEIVAVKFDTDNVQEDAYNYRFAGTQTSWGLDPDKPYTDTGNWQECYAILDDFSIDATYIHLPIDDDNDASGDVYYKDVRIRKYVDPEPSVSITKLL